MKNIEAESVYEQLSQYYFNMANWDEKKFLDSRLGF